MKILFVSSDKYPPFRVDVTELFGKELVGRGHTIDWLLHSEEACKQEYQTTWSESTVYVGATDTGETILSRVHKHWLSVKNDFKMFSLARTNSYDFILVKDKFFAGLIAMFAAKKGGCQFLYWLSYPFPEASLYEAKTGTARYPFLYMLRGKFFDFLLYKIFAKSAKHVFVQSQKMKDDMTERGVDEKKMTPVPMGFSSTQFETLINAPEKPVEEDIDILYLGTLLGARKMDFMVRVLKAVQSSMPNAQLVFVGDGETPEDRQQIEDEATRLGLEANITITGFMPQNDALEYVRRAKVCVSPFFPTPILNSTSPTKLIEYMAMGKALVANDHPEQSLVIEKSECGLCVSYDEEAFGDAIVTLLNNPKLREEMGRKGRQYVAEHRTYDKIASLVEHKLIELTQV